MSVVEASRKSRNLMESNFESERFQIDVITTLFPTTRRTKVVERGFWLERARSRLSVWVKTNVIDGVVYQGER